MDLKDKTLEEWLKKQKKSKFPLEGKIDYYCRYKNLIDYLNTYIHPHVTPFASIIDGGYYTDHGPDHIKKVIRKASDLVNYKGLELTPYEVYFLLVAIHFHDVGHIKGGRYHHEMNARQVMHDVGDILGTDGTEKTHICQIAEAHGGSIDGDKDKLRTPLEKEDSSLHQDIRPLLLAAILRFADELSDDRERSARFLMDQHVLPPSSEIFHRYAYALHTVKIDHMGNTVEMYFDLNKENVSRKYGKYDGEIFLLDEIYKRTLKTYSECKYCMRFIPLEININSIKVKIRFIDENWENFRNPISYRLTETGYPDSSKMDIFSMCPNELKINGDNLTGDKLKELVEKNGE